MPRRRRTPQVEATSTKPARAVPGANFNTSATSSASASATSLASTLASSLSLSASPPTSSTAGSPSDDWGSTQAAGPWVEPAAPKAAWATPRTQIPGSGVEKLALDNSSAPLFITERANTQHAALTMGHQSRFAVFKPGFRAEHADAFTIRFMSVQMGVWCFEAVLGDAQGRAQSICSTGLAAGAKEIKKLEADDDELLNILADELQNTDVLERMVLAKFLDASLKVEEELLLTGSRRLVYLSKDRTLGCGFDDATAANRAPEKERGLNLYGKALERARTELMKQEHVDRRARARQAGGMKW